MAVSSPLNPATIVKEKQPTAAAAQNFITGGSPLGTGVVASAANKIVGFQRGAAAGVAAKPPDLQSIIQTLSSNILTNVENRIQSINQNVTQLVNNNLKGLGDDYKSRLNQIDAAKPNSILNNFLSLYREAIGYIQFLGNRKNVKTLGDNLEALQNVFAETFNVAKLVRRTIVKIVQQLSSLPQASTGPGGINLDVSVPGGPLRRSAPNGLLRMMRRRPGLMLGGAALAGGLGTAVVSGMMDPGRGDVSAAPTSEGTIPGVLLDKFDGILERFSKAISSLGGSGRRETQTSSNSASGSSKSGSGEPTSEDPGSSAGATPMSDATVSKEVDSTGLKSNFAPIAQDIINSGHIDTTKLSDRAALGAMLAVGQMESNYDYSKAYTGLGGLNNNMQGFLQINRGVHPSSTFQSQKGYLDYAIPKFKGESSTFTGGGTFNSLVFAEKLRNATTGWEVAGALRAGGFTVNDFDPLDTAEEANRLPPDQVQAIKKMVFANLNLQATQPTAKVTTPPAVTPDTSQAQMQQQAAQSVAQPPVQQQQSQVTVASPIDASSSQTQSSSRPKSIPPPNMQKGGVSVPFFTSSNDDNYLSLYSRLVYNIIDG